MDDNKTITAAEKPAPKFDIVEFVRSTRREIAKVTWPTRKETLIYTVYIVSMAMIVGLFFFGVDTVLGMTISRILGMRK